MKVKKNIKKISVKEIEAQAKKQFSYLQKNVNYCTRRQCIVFLNSLVVLFEGNQFRGAVFLRRNCQRGIFPRGQWSGGAIIWGQSSRWQLSGGYLSGEQLSSGATVRTPFICVTLRNSIYGREDKKMLIAYTAVDSR